MRIEWWYDDATFHYSRSTELRLACLTVGDDGAARLTRPGETRTFASEDDASIWLGDDEYRRLDDLIADLSEDGISVDPRIKAPAAIGPEVQMVIALNADSETPVSAKPLFVDDVAEFIDPPAGNTVPQ